MCPYHSQSNLTNLQLNFENGGIALCIILITTLFSETVYAEQLVRVTTVFACNVYMKIAGFRVHDRYAFIYYLVVGIFANNLVIHCLHFVFHLLLTLQQTTRLYLFRYLSSLSHRSFCPLSLCV